MQTLACVFFLLYIPINADHRSRRATPARGKRARVQFKFVHISLERPIFLSNKIPLILDKWFTCSQNITWNFVCSKTTHNKWNFEHQKPLNVRLMISCHPELSEREASSRNSLMGGF